MWCCHCDIKAMGVFSVSYMLGRFLFGCKAVHYLGLGGLSGAGGGGLGNGGGEGKAAWHWDWDKLTTHHFSFTIMVTRWHKATEWSHQHIFSVTTWAVVLWPLQSATGHMYVILIVVLPFAKSFDCMWLNSIAVHNLVCKCIIQMRRPSSLLASVPWSTILFFQKTFPWKPHKPMWQAWIL